MKKFTVEYFQHDNGTYPAEDFILSQDVKMRAKLLKTIELLEEKGRSLRLPYSEAIGDGIFEIRVKQGKNISRVLYFFVIGNKIILTNGFVKKTQKLPKIELETAIRYRKIYKARRNQNG